MKRQTTFLNVLKLTLLIASICPPTMEASAQCNQNFIYGLTNTGMIRRITVASGTVAAPMNPAHTGNPASYSNAMGYNPLNGKYYFFKRNTYVAPQEFISFDPATNLYQMLAPSPVPIGSIINLGCVNNSGLGYYCLDALGTLYYYRVSTNTWTTICSNIRDQFNVTLASVIDPMGVQRYYGDIAIDGYGSMWLLISGSVNYGLYKITGPIPTTTVANLTATRLVPPTTASPGGSFGGMCFSGNGDMYLSSNSPDNRLFRLTTSYSLSPIVNLAVDGIGNDLTSCNFPLEILNSPTINLSANVVNENKVMLSWKMIEPDNTRYTIEHSTDGIKWDDIHSTLKTIQDNGNTYTYSESSPVGGTHYYRIRITETDGTITYSTVKKVTVKSHTTLTVWPNPTQDILKIQDVGGGSGTSQAFIFDEAGRMVRNPMLNKGVNSVSVQSLPPGIYIVRVKHRNGETTNQKFLKQ